MEQDKQYFCKTHNAGPFTKKNRGSQNKTIFSFHSKCDVVEYDESLLNPHLSSEFEIKWLLKSLRNLNAELEKLIEKKRSENG